MNKARTKTLFIAVISGLAGRAVALLAPLLVMGPMLDHLGSILFGIWLTAVSLAALANFLDFGIGNAALTRLSEAFGRGDLDGARALLGQAYVLLAGLAASFIVLTIVGTGLITVVLPGVFESQTQATVVAIVLSNLFLTFVTGLLIKLLQARQAYVHAQLVQITGPLAALSVSLLAISAGFESVIVVLLYTLATPLTQAAWSLVYFAARPTQRPAFDKLDRTSIRPWAGIGGAFFVVSILTAVGMNVDNIIIAARAGAEAVTNFGVPARLGSLLMLIVFTIFMPLWTLFGNALAGGDREWLLRTAMKMSAGGALGVMIVGLTMILLADPIFMLWMNRTFPDQQLVLMGMVALATVIALTSPFNMILNAAGMARQQILPWSGFVVLSLVAKTLVVAPETTWWVPWITTAAYAVCVTPRILTLAIAKARG
jgi:O-antigen/teichoic acid export membrane protein